MRKISTMLLVIFSVGFFACGGGGSGSSYYPRFASSDNEIVQYSFPASANPGLAADVNGVINGNSISLEVPNNANTASLIAEFVTNSPEVDINGVSQASGTSSNDFSSNVVYTVAAENQEIRKYTVSVRKAAASEKTIDSVALDGVNGVINQDTGTVAVELPSGTSLKSLTTTFSGTADTVTVAGVEQTSGEKSDFSTPRTYTATAPDGSSKTYTVTATLEKSPWNEITSFLFSADANKSLPADVAGVIDTGNNINVELPAGSSKSGLIATYATNGVTVAVGDAVQSSGKSTNDFSDDVTYRVTAENGDVREYTVHVSVAKNSDKNITRFIVDGETAVIDENNQTISVSFPAGKDLTDLVSSFITNGISVTVKGEEQTGSESAGNFSSEVVYDVKAENGTVKSYKVKTEAEQSITGLWNFEEATDSGYTVSGALTSAGITDNALLFDGYNDCVIVNDGGKTAPADSGTVATVIKVLKKKPYAGIVHKGSKKDFSDESYSLQFWGENGNDGTVRFSLFNDDNAFAYIDSSTKLDGNKWYHLTATWDKKNISLYINGSLEKTIPNTIGKIRNSGGPLVIGAQLGKNRYNSALGNVGFNGIIDRVKILNRSLTADEVAADFSSVFPGKKGAMTAYLLAVASSNTMRLGIVLGVILLMLAVLYAVNRKRMKSES